MSTNRDYVSAMQARMEQFDRDVDALGAEAGARARTAYGERVKDLRVRRDAARKQLLQLQAASESAGLAMHAGIQAAWDAMQAALEKATADAKRLAS